MHPADLPKLLHAPHQLAAVSHSILHVVTTSFSLRGSHTIILQSPPERHSSYIGAATGTAPGARRTISCHLLREAVFPGVSSDDKPDRRRLLSRCCHQPNRQWWSELLGHLRLQGIGAYH